MNSINLSDLSYEKIIPIIDGGLKGKHKWTVMIKDDCEIVRADYHYWDNGGLTFVTVTQKNQEVIKWYREVDSFVRIPDD